MLEKKVALIDAYFDLNEVSGGAVGDAWQAIRATVLGITTNDESAPCSHEWEDGMFYYVCAKCGLVDDA